MWVYLALLLVPLASAVAARTGPKARIAIFWTTGLALLLAMGLRHQIGCDWNAYQYMFVQARSSKSVFEAMAHGSPGYLLLNWIVARTGLGVAGVNTVCALILLGGIFVFSRKQPRPWIAFLVCTPILLMLTGFSATRQSVAVGIFLFCLVIHLSGKRHWLVYPLLLLAGSFHFTALALIPLFIALRLNWRIPIVVALLLGAAGGLAIALAAHLLPGFGDRWGTAGGAWFRVLPTLLALAGLPLVWRRIELSAAEREMIKWLAAFALFCIGLGLFSTILMDRMNYYAIPFQILIFCRLSTLATAPAHRLLANAAIAAPFLVLFGAWLAFTDSRTCLQPYRSYLTEPHRLLGSAASTDYDLRYESGSWGTEPVPRTWPPPTPAPGVPPS